MNILSSIQLTMHETEIEENIKIHEFVIVLFFANSCKYCKEVELKLVSNFPEIKIIKIDVGKNKDIALKYSVEFLPTILVFRKERIISHIVGNQDCINYLKEIFFKE